MSEADAFADLEPRGIWERFGELTRIARPSKREGPAREHVLAWAATHGFDPRVDEAGNVVGVPATDGGGVAHSLSLTVRWTSSP